MGAVLVALAAIICVIGFAYNFTHFIRGDVSPIRPADWPTYLVVATIVFAAVFTWSLWRESWKAKETYVRMLDLVVGLWLIQLGFQIAVVFYPAISRNPQLMWSNLVLGVAGWACAIIGVIDWFRVNVKLVPPSSPPREGPTSSR